MALDYLIKLRDGLSAPATKMAGALQALSAAMRETQAEAAKLGGSINVVSSGLRGGGAAGERAGAGWRAGALGAKVLSTAIVGVATAAATATVAIGRTLVEAAAFREQGVGRFTAIFGDATKAQTAFRDSILIAEKTRFAPKAVAGVFAQIAQAVGDDNAQTRETTGRLLDLVTVNGGGDVELEQALGGVRDVINKNKLMGDDIKQLLTAGLNMKNLAKAVATNFKIVAKDDDDLILKVQKAVSHGQIRGQLAVKSINDAIAAQTGKGAAGQAAFDLGSSTISGLISNIKGGFETLFGLQDTTKWTGIIALKGLLSDVAALFSSTTKEGSAMTGILKGLSDAVAPVLELLRDDLATLRESFTGATVGSQVLLQGVTGLTYIFYGFFKLLSWITYGIIGFLGLAFVLGDFLGDVVFDMVEAGANVVSGFAKGIVNGMGAVKDAIVGMGRSSIGWLKEALGIKSPSRVMMELGGFTGIGFAEGIASTVGAVEDATEKMASPLATGARAGASAGAASRIAAMGGISVTVAPTITSAASDPAAVAAELSPRLAAMVSVEVEQVLERMALQ